MCACCFEGNPLGYPGSISVCGGVVLCVVGNRDTGFPYEVL